MNNKLYKVEFSLGGVKEYFDTKEEAQRRADDGGDYNPVIITEYTNSSDVMQVLNTVNADVTDRLGLLEKIKLLEAKNKDLTNKVNNHLRNGVSLVDTINAVKRHYRF